MSSKSHLLVYFVDNKLNLVALNTWHSFYGPQKSFEMNRQCRSLFICIGKGIWWDTCPLTTIHILHNYSINFVLFFTFSQTSMCPIQTGHAAHGIQSPVTTMSTFIRKRVNIFNPSKPVLTRTALIYVSECSGKTCIL